MFEKFLYEYAIFLFFIVFILGLGASKYLGGNIGNLTPPTPPIAPDPSGNGLIDWLTGVSASGIYFISNIGFFFTLMTVDVGVAWIGTLIFSPAIILLIYGFLKLIRGGG